MKRTALFLALSMGFMAHSASAKTINVVTSFSILGDMVQQVGGEHVSVKALVGPDGDPHSCQSAPIFGLRWISTSSS